MQRPRHARHGAGLATGNQGGTAIRGAALLVVLLLALALAMPAATADPSFERIDAVTLDPLEQRPMSAVIDPDGTTPTSA